MLGLVACSGGGADGDGVSEEVVRRNVIGTAYLGQQKWTEAEESFRSALKLRPDDPLLHTNVAIALMQQSRGEDAIGHLEQAIRLDAGHAHARYNLGLVRYSEGNFEDATGHFEIVEGADPDDLYTRYYLATALARTGREQDAVDRFRKALELDPAHVSSLYGLGRLLLQLGEQDEGRNLVERSQVIRARSGLDQAVGTQYGDQGPYAMGIDYPGDALAAPPPVPVAFAPAGGAPAGPDAAWTASVDGADGQPVVWVASPRGVAGLAASGSRDAAPPAPGGARVRAIAAGDVDGDEAIELVAIVERGSKLEPAKLDDATGPQPAWSEDAFGGAAASLGEAVDVDLVLVDRDHDGDLDAFWCHTGPAPGCRIATNDGLGTFEVKDSSEHGFSPALGSGPVSLAFSDYDDDRDVDLLVATGDGIRIFSNQRDGTFADVTAPAGLDGRTAGLLSFAVADMNKDRFMDLVVAGPDGVRIHPSRRGKFGAPTAVGDRGPAGRRATVVVFDFDNDGFLDVAHGTDAAPLLHRNLGQGRWETLPDVLAALAGADPLLAFDADADGDLDLAVRTTEGVSLGTNGGGNARGWIGLASRGVGDNTHGIGTKVEVLAGALRQKFEITRPLPVHVGLGDRKDVQSARYLWPSGVLQDEINLSSGSPVEIRQLDRKGTSCPLLYAWRDGGWGFVTDFLGGSAIGYQVAPGVFSVPDTDEYVLIEGGLEPDRDGNVRVRLNNQLEEVIWFDQVELIAVDHPRGVEVYPDERLMPGPPWPEFRLFASADVRPIADARGNDGQDVTFELRERDRRYVADFDTLPFKGYAESHTLELDLGLLPDDQRVVLLLDGWIDYADSTANVAAAQAGLAIAPPRLEVSDGENGWVDRTRGRMGFPAGLPKTMTLDLTGAFPSRDARVRITTNMRVYWDRARTMVGGEDGPLRVHRLAPSAADLRFGGFPKETSPDGKKPPAYDPLDVETRSPWKTHAGAYTAFGEVRDLLDTIDDRLVTTRNGDEIELTFRAPASPPPGTDRTWLLFADGFGKDMDVNSAASDEVGPVPFHGMPRYPYGEDVTPPNPPSERRARAVGPGAWR